MEPHRGSYHRFLNKRQDIGGVLKSLVPNTSTPSPTTAALQPTSNSSGDGGLVGALTSLVNDISSATLQPSRSSSPSASSTSLTQLSSSSAGLTSSQASSDPITSSTRSATSTSTSTTSTGPTPTPTSTPSGTVYASSDGASIVYITSTLPATSASATATPHTSFLRDPSLEGGIFALVGIVVLVIIFVVVGWILRRRRRIRLERDLATAVAFDPSATERYERQENMMEKRRLSIGSSGHGHGYGYGVRPAYAPQQEYHGPIDYGQYPMVAYNAPSGSTPYRPPSPTITQPAGQGGANLTRKFSDRKPVPPLLPDPAYNPSNTHVSIPPQLYQQ